MTTDEQIKVLREQVQNLASVANSVSMSADRQFVDDPTAHAHDSDYKPMYAQTAEWCRWVRDMEPGAREALALTAPSASADTEGA